MTMPTRLMAAVIVVALTGCSERATSQDPISALNSVELLPDPSMAIPTARFDPAKIEDAKAAIMQDATVKDLLFDDGNAVEWHVGVLDDGSPRWGYAEAVCIILNQNGVSDDRTDVRVVDVAKLARSPGDFRGASLGHVDCATGRNLGV